MANGDWVPLSLALEEAVVATTTTARLPVTIIIIITTPTASHSPVTTRAVPRHPLPDTRTSAAFRYITNTNLTFPQKEKKHLFEND